MYKIYKHTCKINNKSYIGQTCQEDLNARWQNGFGYKCCTVFYRAILKYGWDNFSHEILEDNIETLELANEREAYWISYFHTYVDDEQCSGYNMTAGGGNKLSEQVKTKIASSLIGHGVTDEVRIKFSENLKNGPMYKYWLGKKRSKETVEKMRQAATGVVESQEQREKITGGLIQFYSSTEASSIVRKDGTPLTRPVRCIETGEIFFSVNEASRQKSPKHNSNGAGHIKQCLSGERKTAYGFHWEEVNEME